MRLKKIFILTACSVAFTGADDICAANVRFEVLAPNAVRVRYNTQEISDSLPEFVYTCKGQPHTDTELDLDAILPNLSYSLTPNGDGTSTASMTWSTPEGEHLYGLGQFQDGYTDVNGLTRRLTQVNTQISIPMLISDRGYGVLWNNYGLTDFNPAADKVTLTKTDAEGGAEYVDVTTTTGNARERRESNVFEGLIHTPKAGRYAVMLDVGQKMARKHNLTVNGKTAIDVFNIWLPPTASTIVDLKEGDNIVTAKLSNGDNPTVYYRLIDGTTTLSSPEAENVDFTVFTGTPDEIIAAYREVTGGSPMMPAWALGYIHCRERFHSQDELLANAREFRDRQIPADVMVQDWQWWGKHGWNAMRFDEDNYPDPKALVDSLHNMDMRLMLSVWSKIDRNSELGKETAEKGYYIPDTEWIDFFNPEAAGFYWNNFSDRLLKPYHIDAWWQDATEPENDDLAGRRVMAGRYRGETFRNVYPLMVNRTVFEGLRQDDPSRRTMILTRCGFPGIQRYGAAMWSGDVGNDWQTLRTQLASGLGMMAAGLPWWTYDAGGFFRPGDQHRNPAYQEVMTRWIQTSVFLPLMRVHGYMSDTEPWRYGEDTQRRFADAIALRYRLFPYIYSTAHRVSADGYTMMRPLVFDYPKDSEVLENAGVNFMFGPSMLVSPVLESGLSDMEVYLPKGKWYDFRSGQGYDGGALIKANVSPEDIPVFVKAGSIMPLSIGMPQSASKISPDLEIAVWPGADGEFNLYEDDGVTYDYEKGEYSEIPLKWDDSRRILEIGARKGSFSEMPSKRTFTVTFPDGTTKSVSYKGKKISVKF